MCPVQTVTYVSGRSLIALSRPMNVSITNSLPGTIFEVDYLEAPMYAPPSTPAFATSLVTWESVGRLGLESGLKAWAMIKTVAIERTNINGDGLPEPHPPLARQKTDPNMP